MVMFLSSATARDYAINGSITGVPVEDVLEAYREQGLPLAWSSNLVPGTLLVLSQPRGIESIEVLAEVLGPHELVLKYTDGIYLVVRAASGAMPANHGSLLVIVRDRNAKLIKAPISINARPPLPTSENLGDGVLQFREVQPAQSSYRCQDADRRSTVCHARYAHA